MRQYPDRFIYLVDDDQSVLRALERFLSSAGFRVEIFSSGKEFFSSDFQEQNACLVVDVKMPDMTGLELYQHLLSKGIHIPIIFITANDSEDIRQQAVAITAAGYFRKPVDGQALVDSIHWAFSAFG